MADPVHSIGFLGGSKKLQKENAGKEPGQPMLFAGLMVQASHIRIQGEKIIARQGKTGAKEFTDHKIKIFHKKKSLNGNIPGSLKSGLNNPDIESGSLKSGLNKYGVESGPQILGLNKQSFESRSLKSGLTIAGIEGVEKNEIFKKTRGAMVKHGNGKNEIENLLKNQNLKGEETIIEQGKTGVKEFADHEIKIFHKKIPLGGKVPGSLKSGLNNPGIEPGSLKPGLNKQGIESGSLKSGLTIAGMEGVEKDEIFKKTRGAMVKHGNGKNEIENLLKNQNLKGEKNIVDSEKTEVKEFIDHKIKILPGKMPLSSRLVDKMVSGGGYHHIVFHGNSRTAAVNESVNNYVMEPRALINQIAKGVNREGRVKIVLTPPHLGTLNMDVIVRNNKVHVILQTEHNDVKHILQSNVETLKTALRSQGLITDNIIVIIQEKLDSAGYSGFGRNETLFKEDNNQKKNQEDQTGSMDSMEYVPSTFDEKFPVVLIDGRISLFA